MQFGVSESIFHWGKYRPKSVAIYSNNFEFTYQKLNNDVNLLYKYLENSNIKNNRIGIAISNKYLFVVALTAILRLKKSAVILNIGLSKESLIVNCIDTSIDDIIFDKEYLSKYLKRQAKGLHLDISKFDFDKESNSSFNYQNTSSQSDEWGVLFSSGTSGTPKGISRNHYSIVTENIGWCLELGLNRYSKFYIGRPLYYTGGLVLSLSTLLTGGTIIANDLENENDFMEAWLDYQSTLTKVKYQLDWAFFIPDQIRLFCETADVGLNPKYSKFILTMGAPISGAEKLRAKEILKSNIIESWGNSESLGTITDPEDLDNRPNSVGRPFLTDEMYIIDDNYREIKTPNVSGRISGHLEAGFNEYVNRKDATERTIKDEKIISEDIGYIDENGYLYIQSRVQEMLIINNQNIFLPKIESKIRENFKYNELCITFVEVSSKPKLCLVLRKNENILSIKKELLKINKYLEDNEKLSDIILMEDLPKLGSGKVDKIKVKEYAIQSINFNASN